MQAIEPGKLPKQRFLTIDQFMFLSLWCDQTPLALVIAAYNKSVPTAMAGCTLNPSTSNGVISEPPPTPVKPITKPTAAPANMYRKSKLKPYKNISLKYNPIVL